MARFFLLRIVRLIAVLVAITVVSCSFMKAIPGDPVTTRLGDRATTEQVAALRQSLGLDKPWYVQLGLYVAHAASGDLGRSIVDNQSVAFAWPGVGRLAFDAIGNRDMPLINGCILLFATVFVIVNTIVDLLYAAANPRIRYGA